MKSGFARPLLVIIILLLLSLPLAVNSGFIQQRFNKSDVKGSKTSVTEQVFSVRVISNNGSWEMVKYLCKTEEECLRSLESGKRLSSVGGGVTIGQNVNISSGPEWEGYKYVKLYVMPGLNSSTRVFDAALNSSFTDGQVKAFSKEDAFIMPVSALEKPVTAAVTFSDNQ